MAYMESIEFSYDGKYSSDYGIFNISMNSGMYQEIFTAKRSIIETKVRGNGKPYFHGLDYEPLEMDLSFAFDDTWDDDTIREVARWLTQDYYKPLWFVENPNRIYYCMSVDEPKLVHNGLKQGYITLKMRCDSSYIYSPIMTDGLHDFSTNVFTGNLATLDFTNSGDVDLLPEIWIKKIGNGDVSIINNTNGAIEFKFTGLVNNETVYVDNAREYIETDVPLTYRYSNFNNNFLSIVRGKNTLAIKGDCHISFRYQLKILQ